MIRYEMTPPAGVPYQSWLRRRIANLERLQAQRIDVVRQRKRQLNATIVRAQRELDNLKAQQTIAVAPKAGIER